MKQNSYLASIIFLTLLFACNHNYNNKSTVVIKGTGFEKEFKNVTLKYYDYNTLSYRVLESKLLTNNDSFEFVIPFESSNLYELNFDEKEFIPISVESNTSITFQRINGKTLVEGSESTKKAVGFRALNDQLQAKYFGQLKMDFDKALAENDKEKITALTKKSELLIQDFLKEFRAAIINLGTSPAAFYGLQFSDFNKELDFIETRLEAFKKEVPNSAVTKALEKQVYQVKVTSMGSTPPAFESETSIGNRIALSDFKGKVVLIDFWASWCRACRVENPKFASLYEKYKTKNFDIISVSQDESKDKWLKSIKKDGIGAWYQIQDANKAISKLYSVSSLPQNVLLDTNGKIIAKNISADELESKLMEL